MVWYVGGYVYSRDYAKRKFVEVAEAGKRGEKGEHKAKQMKKRPKWARG